MASWPATAQRAVDAAFARFGVPADFTPDGGAAVAVTVLRKAADGVADPFATKMRREATVLHLRVADVAAPAPGDRVDLVHPMTRAIEASFLVEGQPLLEDPARLVWTLDLKKVPA